MIEQIIQFIINHWLLCSILVLILILLMIQEIKAKSGGNRLSPTDAIQFINHKNAFVLDIRTQDSFATGHILRAMNIPQSGLLQEINKIKKYKDKPVIVVCNTGQMSTVMASKLTKEGFNQVYVLVGGIQGWTGAGLPLTKSG